MSFSSETKAELCREKLSHLECVQAEAYGVLLFCNVYTPSEVRITTRSLDFAQRLPKLFHRAFEVTFDQMPEEQGGGAFVCTDREQIARMMDAFGANAESLLFHHINYGVLEERGTKAAFLRGAFLTGGSVTDPQKRYHLELTTSHYYVHRELQALLPELDFHPKETTRKSNYVTYFKQSEAIADVLTTIGAPLAAMEVMNAKVEKNLMNGVNRRLNCDVANVDKAVQAAQGQIQAIHRLESRGELAKLPEKLQETARLRLDYPELSLAQLAEAAMPPVTKSCLNHRLRKLVELRKQWEAAERAEFILFHTGWSRYWGQAAYYGDYPYITHQVADWLLKTGKKGIGLDTIGLDPIADETLTLHRKLLADDRMVIIENLTNLEQVGDGVVFFCALPLKQAEADGAPIRAAVFWAD